MPERARTTVFVLFKFVAIDRFDDFVFFAAAVAVRARVGRFRGFLAVLYGDFAVSLVGDIKVIPGRARRRRQLVEANRSAFEHKRAVRGAL